MMTAHRYFQRFMITMAPTIMGAMAGLLVLAGPSILAADTAVLEGPTRVSFADLGWEQDATLTRTAPSASVRFRLPEGAVQGDEY